uniref:Sugar phosphate transporter domain-containing protein n=1 Tax=Chrysotila carterae TaxID=13221 RepID=A0A7S4F6F9_CHRCT|mmetsp:Transcript_449/g.899  ORF Transcript_449/g.899 Transcript_449/m.899 type:complete len:320 (+) Transcript_449:119-1078(+)
MSPCTRSVHIFAIVGYGTCSSLMLVLNKLTVHLLPAPSLVLLLQFASSWTVVKACGLCGLITVDALEWSKLRAFFFVSLAFLACVFANLKSLQFANVETFIVFRAATPLVISVADFAFLGRELPGLRSAACLLALAAGAAAYTLTDAAFEVHGYLWVAAWFTIFCFDQLYIKHMVDSTAVESNWGRVFYTNLWASVLSGALLVSTEPHVFTQTIWTPHSICALAASCTLGVGISYFAFLCRAAVSATCFTVIGNVCKVLTVLINVLIWDKHASAQGLCALGLCLLAAAFYKQAPKRGISDDAANYAPVPQQLAPAPAAV